jgi:hypothetical protein
MKTKTLTITCVIVALSFTSCVKENESDESCQTCKAKNNEGAILIEKQVCNEFEENGFREEYYRYQVTCN